MSSMVKTPTTDDKNLNIAPLEEEINSLDGIDFASLDPAIQKAFEQGSAIFQWSGDTPHLSANFARWRDSLVEGMGVNDKLEIRGYFHPDERVPDGVEDLGLMRADKLKAILGQIVSSDKIQMISEAVPSGLSSDGTALVGATIRRLINNESVIELPDRVIINFPHASDDILENAQLNSYLDKLVLRLTQTDERLHVVGHTDNTASVRRNNYLGMLRADAVKNMLVGKGISTGRITTESKGESTPIATNTTDEGRKKNRRVELTIISS